MIWNISLTLDQLKKRGFSLASRCPFCGKVEEVMEHIFIHCPMIWHLWTVLFSAHGSGWVCRLLVKGLILGRDCFPSRKKEYRLWRAAPLCLMWAIWKEGNRIIFEDDCFSLDRLKSLFLRSRCSWASLILEVVCYLVRSLFCCL